MIQKSTGCGRAVKGRVETEHNY